MPRNIEPHSSLSAPHSEEPASSSGSDNLPGPAAPFWEALAILTIVFMLVIFVNIAAGMLQLNQTKPPAHDTAMSPADSAGQSTLRN
ncbi:hypothetical protein [Parvibaculum sp.]|uniref:hypothetical protein n=1 Tax=Parvibaculum sp. TaxID=2024848 RepID=UPI00321149B8